MSFLHLKLSNLNHEPFQISSVMEENNLLTKTYQDAKEELQALIIQMERQLREQKERENALSSDVENLKAELSEKSVLQTRIIELEEELLVAKTHLKEEVLVSILQ